MDEKRSILLRWGLGILGFMGAVALYLGRNSKVAEKAASNFLVARCLLDRRFGLKVKYDTDPNRLILKQRDGWFIREAPHYCRYEITTRREGQKRHAWEQVWRLAPVESDQVRLYWQISSRWDGKPEFTKTTTISRKALAAMNGNRGLRLWAPRRRSTRCGSGSGGV